MPIDVALRGRTQLAALLQHLEQEAGQREQGQRCDQRNRRTWRQLIVGVLVARSTRLVALGRVLGRVVFPAGGEDATTVASCTGLRSKRSCRSPWRNNSAPRHSCACAAKYAWTAPQTQTKRQSKGRNG